MINQLAEQQPLGETAQTPPHHSQRRDRRRQELIWGVLQATGRKGFCCEKQASPLRNEFPEVLEDKYSS